MGFVVTEKLGLGLRVGWNMVPPLCGLRQCLSGSLVLAL